MRKVIVLIISILLISCSNKSETKVGSADVLQKEETISTIAEKNLLLAIDEKYPHSDTASPEIGEKDILFSMDSLYVVSFMMKYQNEFGGYSRDKFEYVLVREKDAKYRQMLKLYDKKYNFYEVVTDAILSPQYANILSDSMKMANLVYSLGVAYCIASDGVVIKQ